jgi:N-methylhydantoinase B
MNHDFTFEVIRDNLDYFCEEMMAELRKICVSTVIREAQDCATGITTGSGELVAQSSGTPGHYNSIPTAVKGTLEKIPLETLRPGDVLVTNDPWICAGHMPDVVIMTPVFSDADGGSPPFAFAVTVAHHLDMGGRNPGSTTANTTDVFQDGLQIPPSHMATADGINAELLNLILTNVRFPDVVGHDLNCEIAVNRRAAERLLSQVEKYGEETVTGAFATSLDQAEQLTREEIAQIPDGSWSWTDFLDSDGQTDEPVKVSCRVEVEGDELRVDFSGSAPQAKGGINMTPSFRDSYTHFAIRCVLDPSIPHNEGSFRPIEIMAEPGTIVSPLRQAPVAGRSVMISRVVDVVFASLSQAVPERARAGYGGCNAQPVVSGNHDGRPFIFLDTNWGGMGGGARADGATCLSFPQNVANHPIEILEASYPVRVERYEIRPDSEGPGRHRGGLGLVKDYRLLADARLDVPGDRTKLPPFGMEGGGEGALTEYALIHDGEERLLPTKKEVFLEAGDVLSVRTSGGGGLGPVEERDPRLIAADLAAGYISPRRAREVYGYSGEAAPLVEAGRGGGGG